MRMNKGGVTPCDRRLDRRKVTLAAAAVLVLSVATAHATPYDFVISPTLSSIKQSTIVDLSGFSLGLQFSAPQQVGFGGSDTAHFDGHLNVDLTGTVASGTIASFRAVRSKVFAGVVALRRSFPVKTTRASRNIRLDRHFLVRPRRMAPHCRCPLFTGSNCFRSVLFRSLTSSATMLCIPVRS